MLKVVRLVDDFTLPLSLSSYYFAFLIRIVLKASRRIDLSRSIYCDEILLEMSFDTNCMLTLAIAEAFASKIPLPFSPAIILTVNR